MYSRIDNPEAKPTVVLIEGDRDYAGAVGLALRDTEFRLEHTEQLSVALDRLGQNCAAAILLDLDLPGNQPIDAFLRVHSCAPDVPIVILCGFGQEASAARAVQEGAQDYLLKAQMNHHLLVRALRHAIQRNHHEQELKHLAAIVESSDDAIGSGTLDGIITSWNKGAARVYGYTADEVVGRSMLMLVPAERVEELRIILDTIRSGKSVDHFETERVRKDGSRIIVSLCLSPIRNAIGAITGVSVIARDVTESKRVERSLREAEEKYRSIFESVAEGVFQTSSDGRFLTANYAWARTLGYDSTEELIASITDMAQQHYVDPQRRAEFKRLLEAHGTVQGFEAQVYRKDRSVIWISLSSRLIRDETGAVLRYEGVAQDITERKRRGEELRRSHQTQEVLNAMLSISMRDISLEETLGQVIDRILTIPWLSLEARGAIFLVEADPSTLALKAQRNMSAAQQAVCGYVPFGRCLCGRTAASGKMEFAEHVDDRHEFRYEGMTPHGHYCIPLVSADKVLGVLNLYVKENHRRESKEEEFLNAVANVVTTIIQHKRAQNELKQALADTQKSRDDLEAAQLQLIQAEKMDSIGRLAAGVAHEVKNPLATATMCVEYLAGALDPGNTQAPQVLQDLRDSIDRADHIVRGLVDFSTTTRLDSKEQDLNAIVEHSLTLVGHELKRCHIATEKVLSSELPALLLDRIKIEQLFVNVFMNAIHAMPKGGILTVETSLKQNGSGGKTIIVVVEDTGHGIPADKLTKVFDPFFTTKPVGKGTGLGLCVARAIVELHGGTIQVGNHPGGGAVVTITLKQTQGMPTYCSP